MCARGESAQELLGEPRDPTAFGTHPPRHGAVLRPSVSLRLANAARESLRGEPGAVLAAPHPRPASGLRPPRAVASRCVPVRLLSGVRFFSKLSH